MHHPEMYLSLRRRSAADDGARLRSHLTRAVATVRAAATPSTCSALA